MGVGSALVHTAPSTPLKSPEIADLSEVVGVVGRRPHETECGRVSGSVLGPDVNRQDLHTDATGAQRRKLWLTPTCVSLSSISAKRILIANQKYLVCVKQFLDEALPCCAAAPPFIRSHYGQVDLTIQTLFGFTQSGRKLRLIRLA